MPFVYGMPDAVHRSLHQVDHFANADTDSDPFVHPVLRAILLHFWLAYDHPFEDGNGRKVAEIQEVERLTRASSERFNHRQLALLSHAVRNPGYDYTFHSHSSSHTVTHETARNDIVPLVEMGLLERRRIGRQYRFSPQPDLARRLERVA